MLISSLANVAFGIAGLRTRRVKSGVSPVPLLAGWRKGCAGGLRMPSWSSQPIAWQSARYSQTSSRRSPVSILQIHEWGTSSFAATARMV